jgi:hypothetical protein
VKVVTARPDSLWWPLVKLLACTVVQISSDFETTSEMYSLSDLKNWFTSNFIHPKLILIQD